MSVVLGLNGKMYYGNAGSTATNLLANVKDVTLNLSKGEADITTRASQGWRSTVGTLKEGEVSFTMVWDTADAGFAAIQAAWENDTAIALLILDAESGTGTGLDADFSVINFTRNENLEEAFTVDVSCKPVFLTRAPDWVNAGS